MACPKIMQQNEKERVKEWDKALKKRFERRDFAVCGKDLLAYQLISISKSQTYY